MAGARPRPFGVTLIALMTLIWVLVTLVQVSAKRLPPAVRSEPVALWAGLGLLGAAGLFQMRRWGWWITLVYYVGVLVQYAALILGRYIVLAGEGGLPVVLNGGFAVLVIWYLLSRDNRAAFFRR